MNETFLLYALGLGSLAALVPRLKQRLELSQAKHPSLNGHSRMAKRVARLVPFYAFDGDAFFNSDKAPPDIARRRQAALVRLSDLFSQRFPKSIAMTAAAQDGIADLQRPRQRCSRPAGRPRACAHERRHADRDGHAEPRVARALTLAQRGGEGASGDR